MPEPDAKVSKRIGFIVGKTCDAVEDALFTGDSTFLRNLPNDLRIHGRTNKFLKYLGPREKEQGGTAHVDVAIAWYIHRNYADVEVDIIDPREICSERLSRNVCNFILGWDLIDAALEGPERLMEVATVFRRCDNLVPSLEVQEFIYLKSRYLKACAEAGVEIAPTIFVTQGEVDSRGLLRQIKARGWQEFVIKRSFSCWSIGLVRYTVDSCEKSPEVLDKYFQDHLDCPEFLVQEALAGFARHWETRIFWWAGKFVYAVANQAAVATRSREKIATGTEIPEEFLREAKRVGRAALNVLPELKTPRGHPVAMTLIRTDIGCSEGQICDRETNWDPQQKTFFLNEIEYGGTNYFARHLKFDCIPLWGEKYAKKALEILERDGPRKLAYQDVGIRSGGSVGSRIPRLVQPHLTLHTIAHWLSHADALLVGSGSGFSANAALLAEARDPRWLASEPAHAWGYWRGCCSKIAQSKPHAGYGILLKLAAKIPCAFSITSNEDGQWASSGWKPEHLLELNGSFDRLQCRSPGCNSVWHWSQTQQTGSEGQAAQEPLCPRCGGAARPCVRLGSDDAGFCPSQLQAQRQSYTHWDAEGEQLLSGDPECMCVCLELGCAPNSDVRDALSKAWGGRCRLIRVNSSLQDAAPDPEGECPVVSVHMSALNALYEIERIVGAVFQVVFICQDRRGNGAEVLAPADSSIAHIFRKTLAAVQWSFRHVGKEGVLECEIHNVMQDTRRQHVRFEDSVPADFFVSFAKAGFELPVTRIVVRNGYFGSRNPRLEARTRAVQQTLEDLNTGFCDPDYQRRLRAAKDRITVQALIREVQLGVMEQHGWPVSGAKPKRRLDLVLQMKGFNQSGMQGLPFLSDMVTESLRLSGVHRLESLPLRTKVALPPELLNPEKKPESK